VGLAAGGVDHHHRGTTAFSSATGPNKNKFCLGQQLVSKPFEQGPKLTARSWWATGKKEGLCYKKIKKMVLLSSFDMPWRAEHSLNGHLPAPTFKCSLVFFFN
jgi:hypothetical protein